MRTIARFLSDESGAVTIDWVALTAGILLLGMMVVYAIFNTGVADIVASMNSELGLDLDIEVGTAPALNN